MGQLAIAEDSRVFLDANAVIYTVEEAAPFLTLLLPMWKRAANHEIAVFGSELLIVETLVKPIKDEDRLLERKFRALFQSDALALFPVNLDVLEKTLFIRATYGIRTPDAIHLATAILSNADLFITNDRKLKRVTELNVLVLNDLLETTE